MPVQCITEIGRSIVDPSDRTALEETKSLQDMLIIRTMLRATKL